MIITHTVHLILFIFLVNFLKYDNNSYIIIKINIFKYNITNFEILFHSIFIIIKNLLQIV